MYNHGITGPRPRRFAFTLVEVIVVAVIVAILAAVAIPNYMQYLADSRQAAVDQLAESAAANANSWVRRKGVDPTLTDLNLSYDSGQYGIAIGTQELTVTDTKYSYSATRRYK